MHKARVRTLQALVAGMPCIAAHPNLPSIKSEFAEVYAVRKVRRATRRRILEVLHSTRALDTTLATFVGHHGCRMTGNRAPKSLGQYLYALRDHTISGLGQLTEPHRHRFNSNIAAPRNRYMHEAGAFPALDSDLQQLLSEMDTCLTVVFRL
jgi:hypothetical protein